MDWERLCRNLQLRIEELERENRELRRRLGIPEKNNVPKIDSPRSDVPIQPIGFTAGVHMRSTPEEKIRLFRSLFRG